MNYHSSILRQYPLRQDPPATLPLPRSTLHKRTRFTLQLQSGTDVVKAKSAPSTGSIWVPFWSTLVDITSETDPTACGPFAGRRPTTPDSSSLRLFGSTLRFFAKADPFFQISNRLTSAKITRLGGVYLPASLGEKLLLVYDALRQTRSRSHYFDVPRDAPTDVFELCLSVIANYYAPGDPRLRLPQVKQIILSRRDPDEQLLTLDQDTDETMFNHMALVPTSFEEFKQLVALYKGALYAYPPESIARTIRARSITVASTTFDRFKENLTPEIRGSLLQGAQLMPSLSRIILTRINHFYRMPFSATQLALLLRREGVIDAVAAGDYVVSAGVYTCTVEYGRGFLGRNEAQGRAYEKPTASPPFLNGLYQDVRACTGVAPLGEEVLVAILKDEGILTPSETLGKFDCPPVVREGK